MPVNKAKPNSNMYPGWDTWNPYPGCLHDCLYCYGKAMRGYDMTPRFRENYLKDNLGTGRKIFICSMGDIGGDWVDQEDVKKIFTHCSKFDNLYLAQSKDPGNLIQHIGYSYLPNKIIFGTTIEGNRNIQLISKAPATSLRMMAMVRLKAALDNHVDLVEHEVILNPPNLQYKTMLSLEPLLDFDPALIEWIRFLAPNYVSIGLDSKRHKLGEPTPEKILYLIKCLQDVTEVRLKANLRRLIPEHDLYGNTPVDTKPVQGQLEL